MHDFLQVETTLLPKSRIGVEVTIPMLRCQESYNLAIERLKNDINLPGFRKGKIPNSIVLQQMGQSRVNTLALEILIETVYSDILKQESINAIGQPELSESFDNLLERFRPSKSLTLIIETDIAPTPILKKTKGLEVTLKSVEYKFQQVDELIEQAQKRLANIKLINDRAAEINDIAVIHLNIKDLNTDYNMMPHDSNILEIELDEPFTINGLTEGILGMRPGDNKIIECQFPEDYSQKEYRGHKVNFHVLLKTLKVRELPQLNDAFTKRISEQNTLSELRSELESYIQKEVKLNMANNTKEALLTALVKELQVELPETLIQQEIHSLIEKTASQIAEKGADIKRIFTPEVIRKLIDTSRPEAEERLKKSLALKALAEAEKITINGDEINNKIKQVNQTIKNTNAINQSQLKSTIAADLLKNKLLDWLQANSVIQR